MTAKSLPVRGAWIEIVASCPVFSSTYGRSPCGERGLKCAMWKVVSGTKTSLPVRGAWIEMEHNWRIRCYAGVAPRAGSVD